jgi:hypothetical protein
MNTEEREEDNINAHNRGTANLFAVAHERLNNAVMCIFSPLYTDSNQRQHHRNPESFILASSGMRSDRENSGFSI